MSELRGSNLNEGHRAEIRREAQVDNDAEAAAFLDAVFHLAWLLYRLQPPRQYRFHPAAPQSFEPELCEQELT